MTETLDGGEDQRRFSRCIFVPSPSCPLAGLLVLTARFFTYSPTWPLCSILYSMWLLLAPVPASLRPYKFARHQRVLRVLPCTASRRQYPQQATLATMLSVSRFGWPSLEPAPHRRSHISRSFPGIFMGLLSRTRPVTVSAAVASLCPSAF